MVRVSHRTCCLSLKINLVSCYAFIALILLSTFNFSGYEGEVDGEIIEIQGEKRLIPSALLDNLRYNVLLNSPCSEENTVKVRHLDWYDYVDGSPKLSNENESKDEEYDLIIGSDLINWEDDVGK